MLETIIKMFGSVVGPFTRGRPEAEWKVKKLGVTPYSYIHIKNPGPGRMFIREVHVDPPIRRG
jgi:hypothetical protein